MQLSSCLRLLKFSERASDFLLASVKVKFPHFHRSESSDISPTSIK